MQLQQTKIKPKKIYTVVTEESNYSFIASNPTDAVAMCYCVLRENAIDVYEAF